MMQLITGQLVQLYDEEFRTLFARSTVPTVLSPGEGRANGYVPAPGFKAQCGQAFERADLLRHTLDTVYLKACGKGASRKNAPGDREDEYLDRLRHEPRPAYDPPANARARPQHLQNPDTLGFLKRHSYAGERQEASFIPTHPKYGASNWNVSGEGVHWHGSPGRNNPSRDTGDPPPQSKLGQVYGRGNGNLRQSFHGNDKHILSTQQNLPSLDRTTKSFLRTWRIESYLNSNEVPLGESTDYLDQYETLDSKPSSYMSSRLRSSIIFSPTIPEQPETNSNSHNLLFCSALQCPYSLLLLYAVAVPTTNGQQDEEGRLHVEEAEPADCGRPPKFSRHPMPKQLRQHGTTQGGPVAEKLGRPPRGLV